MTSAVSATPRVLSIAIGAGKKARELPSTTALQEALRSFSKAVAKYCRVLAANVEEDDPQSVERFRKAVAPIDEYRSRQTRSAEPVDAADPAAPVVEPEPTPTPVVAPAPAPTREHDSPFIE